MLLVYIAIAAQKMHEVSLSLQAKIQVVRWRLEFQENICQASLVASLSLMTFQMVSAAVLMNVIMLIVYNACFIVDSAAWLSEPMCSTWPMHDIMKPFLGQRVTHSAIYVPYRLMGRNISEWSLIRLQQDLRSSCLCPKGLLITLPGGLFSYLSSKPNNILQKAIWKSQ